ncbi:MAG: RNA-binding S4 domain-containing protein [Chitinophagales bacterium]
MEKIRVDKWLWAVRVFKTRSLASEACKAGRVKIEGKSVKPSYQLKLEETVSVQKGQEKRIVKAIKLIEKRVGAKIAVACYEDFSPPPPPRPKDLQKAVFYDFPVALRKRGTGRPTKKERRELDNIVEDFSDL